MNPATLHAEQLLKLMESEFSHGRALPLIVTGYSMSPTLKHLRDQVILVAPNQRELRRGEIVFFQREDGTCILHRIRERKKDGSLVINGDAQVWTEKIQEKQVLAVAAGIIRRQHYISCDNRIYRFYTDCWQLLLPFRRYFIKLTAVLRKFRKTGL